MDYFLVILGILSSIIGIAGSILPAIPGPPLSYIALILLQFSKAEPVFSENFLIRFAFYTVLVFLLDYILPLLGAKLYGTTKYGIRGAIAGMIVGLFIIPPFGMILGIFLGAIIGELTAGKESSIAFKTGLITFLGSMIAAFIKLSLSLVMAFYFFTYLFKS